MDPWYATREDVMSGADVKASARTASQVDADIEAATRTVEQLLHRKFFPWTGVRYFDFPAGQSAASWRVWFDQFDLTSLTAVANGDGSSIPVPNVFLNPQEGPPYTYAEVSLATSSAFAAGSTWQRALAFTGVWGYANAQAPAGTVVGGVNGSVTSLGVSDSSLVGVGSLLTVGAERMRVTGKGLVDTTADLGADLAASAGITSVLVSSGALVNTGEFITVGAEMMQVVDKAANTLVVKRAVSGSVLATHTNGDAVYAPRTLTVERASTGTTAASHSNADPVTVWVPPGPIRNLTQATAIATQQQRSGGWTKTAAAALDELTDQVKAAYGRYRTAVV